VRERDERARFSLQNPSTCATECCTESRPPEGWTLYHSLRFARFAYQSVEYIYYQPRREQDLPHFPKAQERVETVRNREVAEVLVELRLREIKKKEGNLPRKRKCSSVGGDDDCDANDDDTRCERRSLSFSAFGNNICAQSSNVGKGAPYSLGHPSSSLVIHSLSFTWKRGERRTLEVQQTLKH